MGRGGRGNVNLDPKRALDCLVSYNYSTVSISWMAF